MIISMVFFGVALAIISASVITTNQQVERLDKQEELARNIELEVGELNYLSNNYLLYRESQQADRWESKYSSISADISNLTVDQPKQLVLVNNLKNSQQRLKEIFGDIVSKSGSVSEAQNNTADLQFVQASGSRIGVQTQGMVFDASRLAQMLSQQAEDTKQQNNLFIFALIGAFLAFLLIDYLLINRRTLTSLSNLQTGAEIIGSGNLDYSIVEKKDDEIGELAKAFNRMTANLKTVTASKADLEREIVERKRAEERLTYQANLLTNITDVIYSTDEQLRLTSWNHAAEKVYGWKEEEVLGRNVVEVTGSKFDPEMRSRLARVLAETGSVTIGVEHTTRSGKSVIFESKTMSMSNTLGKVVGFVAVNRDITERKRAEEQRQRLAQELADRAAELQAVLNAAPVAVWIAHDPQCQQITGNAYADQILQATPGGNVSRSALPGEAVVSYKVFRNGVELQPDEMPAQIATATSKPVLGDELELLFPDGRTVYLIESAMPLFNAEGQVRGAVIAGSDVTQLKLAEGALRRSRDELEQRVQERTAELSSAKEELESINKKLQAEIEAQKKAEENLMAAKDAAEAATRAKAEFLANMSHEIRTPMNSIIGFTELLLDEPLSPVQKDNLETIRINGDALLTIINDILDFSKMESDKLVLEDQPFNLRKCVEESLDLVTVKASEKGLNLSYTIDKEVPDTIIGDPGRLRQVLGNLFSNAVKFTDEGEVTISVSSQQLDGTNEVHFAVQDTGIGIPQCSMHQLFQPFNQMEPSTTRLYGGTGLGLAISKKLVELMNGRIWAESEEGVGSTFHFTIRASSGQVEPEPSTVSPQLIGKHVLIIEDNKTNRRILSKQVYDWGMVPLAVTSGQEALRWVQRGDNFDIAILDMDLQDMDALELEEKIRKHNKTLPLVLLTSIGKHVPPNHAYLTKPIKPHQLHKVLTDILPRTDISPEVDIDILPKEPSKSLAVTSGVDQPQQNKPLKILLAEDNMSSQKVALQMLKKLGYKADVVANGIEALQALDRQHYDVVLMDVKMPEMDGLEATRIIRQRWPDNGPKIIAITA
ncbi:MAG TPA: response regulator, partial [Methanotrichaceae archaeon]|nr:response regulator [Methanotrichaceae archaeon]